MRILEKLPVWADSPRVMRWVWRLVAAGCLCCCVVLTLACVASWLFVHRAGYTLAPGESLDVFTLASLDWQRAHHIRETLWLAVNVLGAIVAICRSVLPVQWRAAKVKSDAASARVDPDALADEQVAADAIADANQTRTIENSCEANSQVSSGAAREYADSKSAVFCWPSQRPYESTTMWRLVLRVAFRLLVVSFIAMLTLELVTLMALELSWPIKICPAMRPTTEMVYIPEWIANALMTVAVGLVLAVTVVQDRLRAVRELSLRSLSESQRPCAVQVVSQFGLEFFICGLICVFASIAFAAGLLHDATLPLPLAIVGAGLCISGAIFAKKS